MLILGIETSCDETACALVEDGVKEVNSVVASSKEFHEMTGGIVPEVAARKQLDFIVPVLDSCIGDKRESIDAVAATIGPGLIGSLIVGIEAAKAVSLFLDKPLIPVNHLIGHIYANFLESSEDIVFPALAMVVSGGHTDLVLMRDHGDFEYLGGTLDDAAGEAFDKTARILGIADYLGGAKLSELSSQCKDNTIAGMLPRPMINQPGFDFSFSGLKTAVKRLVDEREDLSTETLAKEFETAVVDVLIKKCIEAAKRYKVASVLLGGGVAANIQLKSRLAFETKKINTPFFVPSPDLCTDNAVYIASAACFNMAARPYNEIEPLPSLGITDSF